MAVNPFDLGERFVRFAEWLLADAEGDDDASAYELHPVKRRDAKRRILDHLRRLDADEGDANDGGDPERAAGEIMKRMEAQPVPKSSLSDDVILLLAKRAADHLDALAQGADGGICTKSIHWSKRDRVRLRKLDKSLHAKLFLRGG
jgi:hypothetical protein